jgi:hypothetical protein
MPTMNELLEKIGSEAGVKDASIDFVYKVEWYGGPWTSDPMTVFRYGEKNPLNPGMAVFVMFDDSAEIRVYSLQTQDKGAPAPKKPLPPSCYHLCKSSRVYTAHSMTMDVFERKIREEFRDLAGLDPEDAVSTCSSCEAEVPEDQPFCGECGQRVASDEPVDPGQTAIVDPTAPTVPAVPSSGPQIVPQPTVEATT